MACIKDLDKELDLLCRNKDWKTLEKKLQDIETIIMKFESDYVYDDNLIYDKCRYYYMLGTGYALLYNEQNIDFKNNTLAKPIYYQRKAAYEIKKIEPPFFTEHYCVISHMRLIISTNLSKWMKKNGRLFCALEIANEHLMDSVKLPNIEDAIKNKNSIIDLIKDVFPSPQSGSCNSDTSLKKWLIDNKLFLNPHSILDDSNIHFQNDLLEAIKPYSRETQNYIEHFTEIKKTFIFSRELLYLATIEDSTLVEDMDETIYEGVFTENSINYKQSILYQTAFVKFYSLFDKMAYLISKYYEVFEFGKERSINFSSIFLQHKRLLEIMSESENKFIRALYFVFLDLKDSDLNQEDIFPDDDEKKRTTAMHLDFEPIDYIEIRNAIEHRSFKIIGSSWHLSPKEKNIYSQYKELQEQLRDTSINEETKSSLELKISALKIENYTTVIALDDMKRKTLSLARLAKNSILYLAMSIIENNKYKSSPS